MDYPIPPGKPSVEDLSIDIRRVVDRARNEWDMTFAEIVGTLTIEAQMLSIEACTTVEDDDDEYDEEWDSE